MTKTNKYSHVTEYFLNRFRRSSGDHVVNELRGLATADPTMTVSDLVNEIDRLYGNQGGTGVTAVAGVAFA
jgi:hypothetical protein